MIWEYLNSFGDSIYNRNIGMHEANKEQAYLSNYILSFNNTTKTRSHVDKNENNDIFKSARNL